MGVFYVSQSRNVCLKSCTDLPQEMHLTYTNHSCFDNIGKPEYSQLESMPGTKKIWSHSLGSPVYICDKYTC